MKDEVCTIFSFCTKGRNTVEYGNVISIKAMMREYWQSSLGLNTCKLLFEMVGLFKLLELGYRHTVAAHGWILLFK